MRVMRLKRCSKRQSTTIKREKPWTCQLWLWTPDNTQSHQKLIFHLPLNKFGLRWMKRSNRKPKIASRGRKPKDKLREAINNMTPWMAVEQNPTARKCYRSKGLILMSGATAWSLWIKAVNFSTSITPIKNLRLTKRVRRSLKFLS